MLSVLDAAEKHGLQLRRAGVTAKRGIEYCGPCPACGGRDRFRVTPESNDHGGTYYCRQCGKKGDSVTFFMDFCGMDFKAAASAAGKELTGRRPAPVFNHKEEAHGSLPVYDYPCALWQEKAKKFLEHMSSDKKNSDEAFSYLSGRGINRQSMEKFNLIINPQKHFRPLSSWGLPEEEKEDGSFARLFISDGLVIPVIVDGAVIRLRIRRQHIDPRYVLVKGSCVEPLYIPSGDPRACVIVEAELDAIMLHQWAGDLVSVMATGSTTIRPSARQVEMLRQHSMLLLAFDYDGKPGDRPGFKACQWWRQTFEQASLFPAPYGKDPGECWQHAREWIEKRLPWGDGKIFLKKKNNKKETQQKTIPAKCEKCWALMSDGENCCASVRVKPLIVAVESCNY